MLRFFAKVLLLATPALAQTAGFYCPVTMMPDSAGSKYGTPSFSVRLVRSTWAGLHKFETGYRQKIVWFTNSYVWKKTLEPELTITGRRLDAAAPPLVFTGANGSYAPDLGDFIMSGVDFPTAGCWEVTGHLNGGKLSFVVLIQDPAQD